MKSLHYLIVAVCCCAITASLDSDLNDRGVRVLRIMFNIWNLWLLLWLQNSVNILTDLVICQCLTGCTFWSTFIDNVLPESCLDKLHLTCNSPKNSSQGYFHSVKTSVLLTEVSSAGSHHCWAAGVQASSLLLVEADLLQQWKGWIVPIFSKFVPTQECRLDLRSACSCWRWKVKFDIRLDCVQRCLPHRDDCLCFKKYQNWLFV